MKSIFARIKRAWNNYLERLAATNTKLYGNGKLDCCDLNEKSGRRQ